MTRVSQIAAHALQAGRGGGNAFHDQRVEDAVPVTTSTVRPDFAQWTVTGRLLTGNFLRCRVAGSAGNAEGFHWRVAGRRSWLEPDAGGADERLPAGKLLAERGGELSGVLAIGSWPLVEHACGDVGLTDHDREFTRQALDDGARCAARCVGRHVARQVETGEAPSEKSGTSGIAGERRGPVMPSTLRLPPRTSALALTGEPNDIVEHAATHVGVGSLVALVGQRD